MAVTLGDRYDVIVLGAGLAGLTAGLFAARQGHSTLVLEASVAGGHLVNVEKIEDFPGFVDGIAGFELCPRTQEQATNAGAEFAMGRAMGLRRSGRDWEVETIDDTYQTRTVIIAVGSAPRSLGIVGEEELEGHGISHCATCDGPLFRGKHVGVVGGGDSALQEALTLAEFASQVTVFDQAGQLSAQHVYRERASRVPTIEVRHSTLVEEILGDGNVEGVRVRELSTGQRSVVKLAGLFPCVGLQPNTAFLQGALKLDSGGHVPTDIWMRTELPGVFAAGDVRQNSASQAITSAGDGATAAIAAHRYLQDPTWWGRV